MTGTTSRDYELWYALVRRSSFLNRLLHAALTVWSGPADAQARAEAVSSVAAHLMRNDGGMTATQYEMLDRATRRLQPGAKDQFLGELVAALRERESQMTGEGWVYLLTGAARAAFAEQDPERSLALADDAWSAAIERLDHSDVSAAKALTRVSVQCASSLGYLHGPVFGERYAEILERLTITRDVLIAIGAERRLFGLAPMGYGLVNVALSTANIWRQATSRGVVGFLTGAERELAALAQGLDDNAQSHGWTAPSSLVEAVRALPADANPRSTAALGRLATELTTVTATLGDLELADRCAEAAIRCDASPVHRLDVSLTLARSQTDYREKVALTESLLREIEAGLDYCKPGQREARMRRAADLAYDLSLSSFRLGQISTAKFWEWQAGQWGRDSGRASRRRGRGHGAPEDPRLPAKWDESDGAEPVEQLPSTTAKLDPDAYGSEGPSSFAVSTSRVHEKIAAEHPFAAVLALESLALRCLEGRPRGAEFAAAVAAVTHADAWCPAGRGAVQRYPQRPAGDAAALARRALEIADEFAQGYARRLRPEVLRGLWLMRDLPIEDRLRYATDAAAAAEQTSQFLLRIHAIVETVKLRHQLGDSEGLARLVESSILLVHDHIVSSIHSAACVDSATHASNQLTELATWLAGKGYDKLAFVTARASSGWVGIVLGRTPSLAREFELYEQLLSANHAGHTDEIRKLQQQLNQSIQRRVLDATPAAPVGHVGRTPRAGPAAVEPSPGPGVLMQVDVERDTAMVQLIASGPRVFALGVYPDMSGRARFFGIELTASTAQLVRLRHRIAVELRPVRSARGARRPERGLVRLHELVVAPVLREVQGARSLVFVLHGALRALPLHSAYGPAGYLIETHRVSYMSAVELSARERGTADLKAAVGGWDPDISAPTEARAIAARLIGYGMPVALWPKARVGRDHILDRDSRYGILHLAAHGRFRGWPQSSESRLELSRSVALSSADWLREGCTAEFVFLNACSIANSHTLPGDLDGFPLAFRVRGARTVVAALGDLPAGDAQEFAATFYRALGSDDSVTALQSAAREAIAAGRHESAWAHYIHDGPAFRLADLHPGAVERKKAVPGGSTTRRSHRRRGGKRR